jgi:hypothetical protein
VGGGRHARAPTTRRSHQAGIRGGLRGSVGGSCPQIAEQAHGHDGDDRHDEEFHEGSFLGSRVAAMVDGHHPSALFTAAYT